MIEMEKIIDKNLVEDSKDTLEGVYRLIVSLAQSQSDKGIFYKKSLELIVKPFSCPYASIYIQMPSGVIEEYLHSGPTSPNFWQPAVRSFMNDALAQKQSALKMYSKRKKENSKGEYSICMLSVPVFSPSGLEIGAVAIVVHAKDEQHANLQLGILESLVNFMSFSVSWINHVEGSAEDGRYAENLSRAGKYSSSRELSFAITNNLRNRMELDQVALGLVRGRKIKLVSISGLDTIPKGSKEVARIHEAMLECLDLDCDCIYQKPKDDQESVENDFRLHRQWHEATGNASVVSILTRQKEQGVLGVLSFRRSSGLPFSQDEIKKIREMVEPNVGAFDLVDRANQTLNEHLAESARASLKSFRKPKLWKKKIAYLMLLTFSLWFMFGTLPYRVSVPAVIEQAQRRHIAAPVESVLVSVNHLQGDIVSKGDVLCVFDSEELTLMRQEYQAQLNVARLEEWRMESNQSGVESKLAQANRKYIEAKLEAIERRIDKTIIKAPYDGMIIQGDLRMSIGITLPQGTPLFEIAKSDTLQISMQVPEQASADISGECIGSVAINARPEQMFDIQVKRIAAEAELVKAKNVFIAQADMEANYPWMKSGMEGVAKLNVGQRPVWWIALHKVTDYLHLNLWL